MELSKNNFCFKWLWLAIVSFTCANSIKENRVFLDSCATAGAAGLKLQEFAGHHTLCHSGFSLRHLLRPPYCGGYTESMFTSFEVLDHKMKTYEGNSSCISHCPIQIPLQLCWCVTRCNWYLRLDKGSYSIRIILQTVSADQWSCREIQESVRFQNGCSNEKVTLVGGTRDSHDRLVWTGSGFCRRYEWR